MSQRTQLTCVRTPDPQKLRDNKCVLLSHGACSNLLFSNKTYPPAEGAGHDTPLSCGPNWPPRHSAHAHISLQVSSLVPGRCHLGRAQRAVFNSDRFSGKNSVFPGPRAPLGLGARGSGVGLERSGGASGSSRGRGGAGPARSWASVVGGAGVGRGPPDQTGTEVATPPTVSSAAPRLFARIPAVDWGLGAGLGVAWSPECRAGDGGGGPQ